MIKGDFFDFSCNYQIHLRACGSRKYLGYIARFMRIIMQKESSRLLYNYWNELRGSRSAPERRNLDPTKIRKTLSDVFILESNKGEDEFLFRLSGSNICSTYRRELKGRSFNDLWHEKDQEALKTLITAVTEDHAVALATFQGSTKQNKTAIFETILLPIRHNGNTNSRILGGLSALEHPYWLGSEAIIEQKITGLRLIWPDDPSMHKTHHDLTTNIFNKNDDLLWQNKTKISVNEDISAIPTKIHGNIARRYSHLSVIDGGKS